MKGAKGLVEPSYVYLPGVPGGKEIAAQTGTDFFSVPIELGVSASRFLIVDTLADRSLAQRSREGHQPPG